MNNGEKEEGRREKEEVLVTFPYSTPRNGLTLWYEKWIPVRSA